MLHRTSQYKQFYKRELTVFPKDLSQEYSICVIKVLRMLFVCWTRYKLHKWSWIEYSISSGMIKPIYHIYGMMFRELYLLHCLDRNRYTFENLLRTF